MSSIEGVICLLGVGCTRFLLLIVFSNSLGQHTECGRSSDAAVRPKGKLADLSVSDVSLTERCGWCSNGCCYPQFIYFWWILLHLWFQGGHVDDVWSIRRLFAMARAIGSEMSIGAAYKQWETINCFLILLEVGWYYLLRPSKLLAVVKSFMECGH